jgi:hypothetical protein
MIPDEFWSYIFFGVKIFFATFVDYPALLLAAVPVVGLALVTK